MTQDNIAVQHYIEPQECMATNQHIKQLTVRSWGQVDSVLREMAELQVQINEEIALFDSRVDRARERMYEAASPQGIHKNRFAYNQEVAKAIEPLREGTERLKARQLYWETMLTRFMRMYYEEHVVTERNFRFGSIHCHSGKVDILLDVDYAKAMIGRL